VWQQLPSLVWECHSQHAALLFLQVFTQVSLVLLLWGTMCGGLALINDVGVILIDRLAGAEEGVTLPDWINGRTCMTAVALLVLFPLCLQRHMREVRRSICCYCVQQDTHHTSRFFGQKHLVRSQYYC
jgi:hypothetical protein